MGKDYYRMLEVHRDASQEVIKKAYQTLALKYHPDRHLESRKKWGEEKFKELSEAYRVLSDPAMRRDYDLNGSGEYSAGAAATAVDVNDEEAYFYQRMGIQHFRRAERRWLWHLFLGLVDSELNKACDDFATVLDDYPGSRHTEESHYYYICTLLEKYRYDNEYLKDAEEEIDEYLLEYPRGRWTADLKLRSARHYLLRRNNPVRAGEMLKEVVRDFGGSEAAAKADLLLRYIGKIK